MTDKQAQLDAKIKAARAKQDGRRANQPTGSASSGSSGFRAGTDLVAAIAVGGFLGYWIDRWLGTLPWMMIIFLFLGFIAGFLNIYRSQTGQDYKIGFKDETKNEE